MSVIIEVRQPNDDVDKIKRVYDMPCDYYFHCGDFTDGFVPVIDYEMHLKETTYEGQLGYSLHYYPVSDRKTFIVNGNHDEYLYKIYNRDIVKEMSINGNSLFDGLNCNSLVEIRDLETCFVEPSKGIS